MKKKVIFDIFKNKKIYLIIRPFARFPTAVARQIQFEKVSFDSL